MRAGRWSILALVCGLLLGGAAVTEHYDLAFAALTAAVVCVWRASVAQRRVDIGPRGRTLRAIGSGATIRRLR